MFAGCENIGTSISVLPYLFREGELPLIFLGTNWTKYIGMAEWWNMG